MKPMLKEEPLVSSNVFAQKSETPKVQENRRKSARLHAQSGADSTTKTIHENRDTTQTPDLAKNELSFHLAQSTWDHIQAFHLLHEQYLTFGYLSSHPNRVHISPWNLEQTSHTLIALQHLNRTAGTITNLQDSAKGIPADLSYPKEMQEIRSKTSSLIELSSFALHYGMETKGASLKLLASAMFYARHILKGTAWVCTVNPRHASFYKNLLLFKQIGEVRSCHSANGAPSVLFSLDFQTAPDRYKAKYEHRSGSRNLYNLFFNTNDQETRIEAFQMANLVRTRRWPKIKNCLKSLRS